MTAVVLLINLGDKNEESIRTYARVGSDVDSGKRVCN